MEIHRGFVRTRKHNSYIVERRHSFHYSKIKVISCMHAYIVIHERILRHNVLSFEFCNLENEFWKQREIERRKLEFIG